MPYIAILYHILALERNYPLVKIIKGDKMPVNANNLNQEERAFLQNIGYKVQFLRKKAGLSQAELAERSGLAD